MKKFFCVHWSGSTSAGKWQESGVGRPAVAGSWAVLVKTSQGCYYSKGYRSPELAAWAADVARLWFYQQGLIGPRFTLNFPNRIFNPAHHVGTNLRWRTSELLSSPCNRQPNQIKTVYPYIYKTPNNSDTFHYQFSAGPVVVKEGGFPTLEAAAWACDKSRHLFSIFSRRKRPYIFPDRVQSASVEELSDVSAEILDLYTSSCEKFKDMLANPSAAAKPLTVEDQFAAVSKRCDLLSVVTNSVEETIVRVHKLTEVLPSANLFNKSEVRHYQKFLDLLRDDLRKIRLAAFDSSEELIRLKNQHATQSNQ